MQIDFTQLSYDPKWYDFETGDEIPEPMENHPCLKIRQMPASMSNINYRNGAMVLSGEDSCEAFKYCLVDWSGIVGPDNKPVRLTEEVKQQIFDFGLEGIPAFVNSVCGMFRRGKESEEKN